MLSLINTHLNGFAPLQNKIFMYCLGSPSAVAMAPVISIVKEKSQENLDRPIDQITAWRFYKPKKMCSKKIVIIRRTFTSYVIMCELEVAKLSDTKMLNVEDHYKWASKIALERKQNDMTAKEREFGTPTAIIMRDYIDSKMSNWA